MRPRRVTFDSGFKVKEATNFDLVVLSVLHMVEEKVEEVLHMEVVGVEMASLVEEVKKILEVEVGLWRFELVGVEKVAAVECGNKELVKGEVERM